jgi:hypothetical protein
MQVPKNTAADYHRRRLLILCAVASCRSIALGFERDLHRPSAVETGLSKLENPMNYAFTVFTPHDLAIKT